jgi:hypothetical protein
VCDTITEFGALGLEDGRFLVLPEKEFKDGHREDLSRSRCINAKQSENTLSESGQALEGLLHWRSQDPKFYWSLQTWSVLENCMCHQLLPRVRWGSSWTWMVRLGLPFSTV